MDPDVFDGGATTYANSDSDIYNSVCGDPPITSLSAPHQDTKGKQKKRKLDADGFVKPNTPDMSHFAGAGDFVDGQTTSLSSDFSSEGTSSNNIEEAMNADPESKSKLPDSPKPIADVMKELGQENKSIFSSWSQSFADSESFELFCPARLDRLLEEAKALEKRLLQQKDRLYQRLQVISRTLEM